MVLLGYENEMKQMLKDVNPGLSRRFQLDNAFVFPDFSDQDLIKILIDKGKQQDLKISVRVAKRAVRKLARARAKPVRVIGVCMRVHVRANLPPA